MQTENTEAVLDDGCFLCASPTASPFCLQRLWTSSWLGEGLDGQEELCRAGTWFSVSAACLPKSGEIAAFAEERSALFPSSSGAPARVAAAILVSMGSVGQVHCTGTAQVTYISCCLLWPCCWDSWVPLGDQCGGPVRALGARAWPSWCEQAFPVLWQLFWNVVCPLRKFLVIVPGILHLWEIVHVICSYFDTAASLAPGLKWLRVVLSHHWPLSPTPSILCLGWE